MILYNCLKEKIALLQIIWIIKKEFFDINQDFLDNYQLQNNIYNSKNIISNEAFALKQSDKFTTQTVLLAAKKQKSINKVIIIFETI